MPPRSVQHATVELAAMHHERAQASKPQAGTVQLCQLPATRPSNVLGRTGKLGWMCHALGAAATCEAWRSPYQLQSSGAPPRCRAPAPVTHETSYHSMPFDASPPRPIATLLLRARRRTMLPLSPDHQRFLPTVGRHVAPVGGVLARDCDGWAIVSRRTNPLLGTRYLF